MAAGKTGVLDVPGTHVEQVHVPGQATAGTVDAWPVFVAPTKCKVTRVAITPKAAVTGHDTNYYSIQAINKGAAGSGTTGVSSVKNYTSGVNGVAFDTEELTLSTTESDVILAEGDVLSLVRTIAASGLAMPQSLVTIEFQPR